MYNRSPFLAAAVCTLALAASTARSALPDIYPDPSQASADVAAALKQAAATDKRVILDFGGNWCTDCHVLDHFFHDEANRGLLAAGFILVHVNIGHMDVNGEIASRYRVPLQKGVPALAVLDNHGKLLYSQRTGEFEDMRRMQSGAVTDFLNKWKAASTR